jgi:hypothetical protein
MKEKKQIVISAEFDFSVLNFELIVKLKYDRII